MFHHRPVAQSIIDIAGDMFLQLMAASFLVLLILIPFFAFRVLGEVVGEANLIRVFLHGRRRVNHDDPSERERSAASIDSRRDPRLPRVARTFN
jgi:hypothetical protein